MNEETPLIRDAEEHASFLRNLALDLVGEDEADDVVQDAMTRLLTMPPRQVRKVRAWLSIVVLNHARSVLRSRERRSRHVELAARTGRTPESSAPDFNDLPQVLRDLIATLNEEQKEILRLRYFEGMSLSRAAARMGRSRPAVQRSHAIALAELRRRLDSRANGDRSLWLRALAPFVLRRIASVGIAVAGATAVAILGVLALRSELVGLGEVPTRRVAKTSDSIDELAATTRQEGVRTPVLSGGNSGLTGFIFDSNGKSVAGAFVRWFALRPEEVEERAPWGRVGLLYSLPEEPIDPPSRYSVQTHSGRQGEFSFETTPADLLSGSVLVASAEGHGAAGCDLAPGSTGPVDIRLKEGRKVLVQVIDSHGAPAAGAIVHHVAGANVGRSRDLAAHQRFLSEDLTTDSSGEASFIEFGGNETFHAAMGSLRSAPLKVPVPPRDARVQLRLMPTFRVAGFASFPDRDQWGGAHVGEHKVEVAGRSGISWQPLAEARDVDGEFGPFEVPLLYGAVEYRVRLEGAPVIPQELLFPPPSCGELLRFDLSARKGVDENLIILDSKQNPIFGARGIATWSSDGHIGRVAGVSGPAGYLYIGSVPAGIVRYQVSAAGYADAFGTFILPAPGAIPVTLDEGINLSGRVVTLHDSPVDDFEVLYWKNGSINEHARRSFFDRENGEFELSLGAGEWILRAHSASHPVGKAQFIRVTEGKENHVELRLADPLLGGGIVIDASSGEPVAGARIQPLSGDGTDRTLLWGEPAKSEADGTFEMMAFKPGQNTVVISAEGFAETLATARASEDGFVDWGEVRLGRPQRLLIRVRGHQELGVGPDGVTAFSTEGYILAPKAIDAEGVVVFDSVPPGDLQLHVGIGSYYARMDLNLMPGGDWSFDVGLAGPRTVSARFFDEEGNPYEESMWMLAGGSEFGHYVLRMDGKPEAGVFVLGGIGTDEVELVAIADDGRTLASKAVDFDGKDHVEVDLRIETSPLLVRVIDPEGAPIAGASVRIRGVDENRVLSVGKSATDGECSLAGAPHGAVIVDLDHPEIGRRFGIPVDASVRRHELVLAAGGRVTLSVRDGDEVLANVETRLQTPDGTVLSDPVVTSSAGTATHARLGAGAYYVYCNRSDAWPVLLACTLGADEEKEVEVALRRLAEVELVVLGSDGLPVPGVPVQVSSTEFATDVGVWLAQEKVRSDTGLVTGVNGRVRIEGLPHGTYGWSISLPEAESAGAFRIDPGENVRTLTLAR